MRDGTAIAQIMPIIATTISNSIRENPRVLGEHINLESDGRLAKILKKIESRFFGTLSESGKGFAEVTSG